jgi:hypothetical protein
VFGKLTQINQYAPVWCFYAFKSMITLPRLRPFNRRGKVYETGSLPVIA